MPKKSVPLTCPGCKTEKAVGVTYCTACGIHLTDNDATAALTNMAADQRLARGKANAKAMSAVKKASWFNWFS